jgi:FkbM family methyltransferase
VGSIVHRALRQARLRLDLALSPVGERKLAIAKVGAIEIAVFANEIVGRYLKLFGSYEDIEMDYLVQHIAEKATVFDVGSNIGYVTCLAAKRAKLGNVHVFEPIPLNVRMVSLNTEINGLKNVIVNEAAVGSSDNTLVGFSVGNDSAYSSLAGSDLPDSRRICVKMVSLNAYCTANGIHRVDVLKIDVEGAEEGVLKGADEILSDPARRPTVIMIELYEPHLKKMGSTVDGVIGLLERFGYRGFVLDRKGRVTELHKDHHHSHYNYFFHPAVKN